MDWSKKDWEIEDSLFEAKRRVDNKISWQHPHIIGTFPSVKMERDVEFHSLNERLFYYLLELDTEVTRYYVQPIEVEMEYLDSEGQKKVWHHVPDVLVFRQGVEPQLFQIKDLSAEQTKTFLLCNKKCEMYAAQMEWSYKVIYPKQMPEKIQSNINFLVGFLKKRKSFSKWIDLVLNKMESLQECKIILLAKSFQSHVDYHAILPLI
ncbi:hypothetical protein [Paenibacillus qinlingensis]|uniref:hypothetical protein n=1 Tax=Paenibacillus qinlingensis TaxID=1837343 RepID=UPI001563106D|nr:hypothetical protein [Paenibacillus qinlingensis]NQX62209.1 hypothetical protein [Paenibacillus qinlingensis]